MSSKISITVNVVPPKHLSDCIDENKKHLINELKVLGTFDCLDNHYIRSMCNTLDENGNRTGGILETINIAEAKIDSSQPTCLDFQGCITLRKIIIRNTNYIDPKWFSGCIALEEIETWGWGDFKYKNGVIFREREEGVVIRGGWRLVKYPPAKKEVSVDEFEWVSIIEDYAFENFRGTDLYVNNKVPPVCTKDAFYNVDRSKVKIHVPKNAFNSYWSHSVWGEFQIVGDL